MSLCWNLWLEGGFSEDLGEGDCSPLHGLGFITQVHGHTCMCMQLCPCIFSYPCKGSLGFLLESLVCEHRTGGNRAKGQSPH